MAAKNGTFQLVGDQTTPIPGSRNSVVPSPSADPKSGTWQKVGTDLQNTMRRDPIYSPSANPKSGVWQMVGTEKEMSRKPINDAFGSAYKTPMSKESSASDANAAHQGRQSGRNKHKRSSY